MDRRAFLISAAGPFGSLPAACTSAAPPSREGRARRTELTVPRLGRISQARRETLSRNPDNRSAHELNETIPEIDAIELQNRRPAVTPRKILRLISWNMARARHWREGARLIEEHPALQEPDIVFLQEMDLGMARSGNAHTTQALAEALQMNYAFGVEFLELTKGTPVERWKYGGANEWGYHGNALLSRYPLRDPRIVRFPGIEKWYQNFQQRLGGRMGLFATLMLPRPVTVVVTHLEGGPECQLVRRRQIEMILEELRASSQGQPVLLGGDLNAPPDEPPLALLEEAGFEVRESNELRAPTRQRSVFGDAVLTEAHIDYLCVRGARVVVDDTSPKVVAAVYPPRGEGTVLSDHAIVTAKVEIA